MKSSSSWIGRGISGLAAALFASAFSLVWAGSAAATPLYFGGPMNFGTTPGEVSTAQLADPALQIIDIDNPVPGLGPVSLSMAGGAGLPNPTCATAPSDPTCLDLTVVIPPSIPVNESSSPGFADPTLATSNWTVTNTSGMDLAEAFLVFVGTAGAMTGDPLLVGLEPATADDYTIINFTSGIGEIFYAAVSLGPLTMGASTNVAVHYVVADDLIPAGGMDFFLPQLYTQAIVVNAVPEPGAFALFATGLVGLAATRRRRRCV